MAEETAGPAGPLTGPLLQHLEWLSSLGPACLAVHAGPDHVIAYANPGFLALAGDRPLLGRSVGDALPELAGQGYREVLDQVRHTGQPFRAEALPLHLAPGTGPQPRYLELTCHPLTDAGGAVDGVLVHGLDITGRVLAQRRLEARLLRHALEQELLAQLGQRTLAGMPAAHMVPQALAELAEILGATSATLWQAQPDRETLRLRFGHGLDGGETGAAPVAVADDNTVSRALREARPVLVDNGGAVNDLAPPLVDCAHARSSANVLVPGDDDPWGVLSLASPDAHRFDTDAALFLQRAADLLGRALRRDGAPAPAPTAEAPAAEAPAAPAHTTDAPATPAHTTEAPAAPAPTPAARGARTVLLVEDEPVVRALTAQLLRRGGYAVLDAGRADDAIALAARRARPIDLLIVDRHVPQLDGREAAEGLREAYPGVPVLHLSGYATDRAPREPGREATGPLLHKPFTAAELMRAVHAAIGGGTAPSAPPYAPPAAPLP